MKQNPLRLAAGVALLIALAFGAGDIGDIAAQTITNPATGGGAVGTITTTGDVTGSGPSSGLPLALTNIPNDTTLALDLLATSALAPATPAAGKTRIYVDSTQKVLSAKNDAGTVSITVVPNTSSPSQFVTGINAAGVPQTAT